MTARWSSNAARRVGRRTDRSRRDGVSRGRSAACRARSLTYISDLRMMNDGENHSETVATKNPADLLRSVIQYHTRGTSLLDSILKSPRSVPVRLVCFRLCHQSFPIKQLLFCCFGVNRERLEVPRNSAGSVGLRTELAHRFGLDQSHGA